MGTSNFGAGTGRQLQIDLFESTVRVWHTRNFLAVVGGEKLLWRQVVGNHDLVLSAVQQVEHEQLVHYAKLRRLLH